MSLDRFPYEPPAPRSIRRRLRLTTSGAVLALLLIAIAALIGYYWYQCQKRVNVGQVAKMLADSGLSAGSSKEEVEEWIHSQHVNGIDEKKWHPSYGDPTMERVAADNGIPPAVVGDVLIADFVDAYVDPTYGGYIRVYFFFDGDHRLIKPVIKRWVDRW